MDYAKIEARILASMGATQRTLFEAAREHVSSAKTPEERSAAKREMYAYLYGTPGPLKNSMTVPVTKEWNYAEDYRRHGGYDGWGSNAND
jgi:hypothetical protein